MHSQLMMSLFELCGGSGESRAQYAKQTVYNSQSQEESDLHMNETRLWTALLHTR